ncbi:MAG: class I SAM-dependent methyltransferase [Nitrospirae bacterium]|nr:class I SAM-dependent methyltransferase [Nitrospirota bacterium]
MDIFDADFGRLIEVLKEQGYEGTKVLPLVKKKFPGPSELLFWINYQFIKENSNFTPTFFTSFYHRRFMSQKPNAFMMFQLFAQNKPVSSDDLRSFLKKEDIDLFVGANFIIEEEGFFRSSIRILSFFDHFIAADPFDRSIKDYTYFGIDSLQLANNVRSGLAGRKFHRAIDIGTGAGVQALNVAHQCDEVVGVDINPRAVRFAQTNARINNITNAKFILSNLFDKVSGTFDLLVSNPPFVFYPETNYDPLTYRDGFGGKLGLKITCAILEQLDRILADNGVAKIICTSPKIRNRDVLAEEITRIFSNKRYGISLKPIRYFMHPNYFVFHRKHHIVYNILYIVTLERGGRFSLQIERRGPFDVFSDLYELCLLYIYFFFRRIFDLVSLKWRR